MNEHLDIYKFEKNEFSVELCAEIKVEFPSCHGYAQYEPGKVVILFPKGTKLSTTDQTKLGNIVRNHVATLPRDLKAEYATATTDKERIDMLAEGMRYK